MSQSTNPTLDHYVALAKAHLNSLAAEMNKAQWSEAELKKMPSQAALAQLVNAQRASLSAATTYTGMGSASFGTYAIYGTTKVTLTFGPDTYEFDGTSWGIGLGGGVSGGAGVFSVPPQSFLGDCHFQQNVAGALTQITFWNKTGALGSFQGAGIGVAASITGGSGTWKKI